MARENRDQSKSDQWLIKQTYGKEMFNVGLEHNLRNNANKVR